MQPQDCAGIWVPLVTPFDPGGRLQPDAIEPIVEWLLARGVRGFLALGTTGEAAHCTEGEALAVVAAAARAVRARAPLLAGSGRPSSRATIAATERLADAGADGVLVLTPAVYRARMDADALRKHYDTVADASPVPVFVYHIPEVTGLDLTADTLCAVLEHPNVWGFKDSATVAGPLAGVLGRVGNASHTRSGRPIGFVGSAARVLEGLEVGAAGGILAVAQVVPEACVAMHEAWVRGDLEAAHGWQARVAAVAAAWQGGWAVAGIKHALSNFGLPAGAPRAPLASAPPEITAAIDAAIAAARAPLD
jgi:dihydrodipicolinate synthase/N-acetylneuraminate lyase